MYDKLFQPGKIGNVTIRNRLVMSPMGIGLAELDGSPSEDMIAYYAARAEGGAGLIIPEITRVNDETGAGMMRQLSVTKDRHIEPLSRLAQAVHEKGSKIFIQLHHPGREGIQALIGGQPVVSASAIPDKYSPQETRALTTEEVKEIIGQFADGALRVKKAGCDGVELHCAHGYLLQQFLSPYTNKRTDEYGGSFENRLRMVVEIIHAIREKCGEDFALGVRLTVDEYLDKTGVTEDYIHREDGVQIAVALEKEGIDFIDVSEGLYETGLTCVEPISFPQGWRKPMIKAVKDAVHIPVIGVSVIREPEVAEQFLEEGIEDFVSMGRPWLCDENWGKKALEGRPDEIRKCISCMRCFESLTQYNALGVPAECSLNPRLARERKYGPLKEDTGHHKVIVVGGGPAGMKAAETLAERGCRVTLYDDKDRLGGTVNLAKRPPLKDRMEWVMDYYRDAFDRLGVEVKLNTKVTADRIAAEKPDAVIVGTGSKSVIPRKIPGVEGDNVYTIEQVLTGKADLSGKTVAMIGAGLTGLETAEYLAARGSKVIIADMLTKLAPNAGRENVLDVSGRLNQYGVEYRLGHALKEIRSDGVVLEKLDDHSEVEVKADAVVLSLGFRPDNTLEKELKEKGIKTILVGSAVKDGTIAPATRTGYEAGRSLFSDEGKKPSYVKTPEELKSFNIHGTMADQEGISIAYLTDPAAIARILPLGLTPFMMPVVTLTVTHIKHPDFADEYYETILSVYAMHEKQMGSYSVALLLGGPGAEMGMLLGRDYSMPKKTGAQFSILHDGKNVKATVTRRGVQLIDAELELGEYNNPMAHPILGSPTVGKQSGGMAFYYHYDRMPDGKGGMELVNGALTGVTATFDYDEWTPAFAKLKLQSSEDDPFADLPVNTIIGGAYTKNTCKMTGTQILEHMDANELWPYLFTPRYDKVTLKGETRR